MSQITTHILDTSRGKPAQGVLVTLHEKSDNEWIGIGKGITNSDGRISDLLAHGRVLQEGSYKLVFDIESYYQCQKVDSFYPYVEIAFKIDGDGQHYHVPLLLNPFGYSTYRGS